MSGFLRVLCRGMGCRQRSRDRRLHRARRGELTERADTDIQEIDTGRFRGAHSGDLNFGHEHLDTRDFMMALKLGSRLAISGVVVRVLLHFKVTPKAREAILWIVMILNCCESNISGHRRLDTYAVHHAV
jgi:hypothetical protein